jgi:hypothetical protein
MPVPGRQAVRILLTRAGMTGEAQGRALLRTGAAGWGTVTDTGVYFDHDAVVACPDGAYLARLPRSADLDLTRPREEVASQVDRVPTMPSKGADLVGLSADENALNRFRLKPPGGWFEAWHETRVPGSRGGRPWVIRLPRAS